MVRGSGVRGGAHDQADDRSLALVDLGRYWFDATDRARSATDDLLKGLSS